MRNEHVHPEEGEVMEVEQIVRIVAALQSDSPQKNAVSKVESWGKQIVILQRGWVMVGELTKDGVYFTLTNASVIRRWGTSQGLGELATKGPLSETQLEPTPLTKFHELTMIASIQCSENKW